MNNQDQVIIQLQHDALDQAEAEVLRLESRNAELAMEVINERSNNALYRAENRALTRRLGEVYHHNTEVGHVESMAKD